MRASVRSNSSGKIPLAPKLNSFRPPHVTRLDPRRLMRRPALLPFRRVLRSPRTLGIGVAWGGRTGKGISSGAYSGRCFVPPFSARQLRRNHFAVTIGLEAPGWISGDLRRRRCLTAPCGAPSMARSPRKDSAVLPAARPQSPTDGKSVTFLRVCFSVLRLCDRSGRMPSR